MRDTRREQARLVAVALVVLDVLFIVLSVLSRASEPVAVVFAVANLVFAGAVVLLLTRPDAGSRDSDGSRHVF